MILEPESANVFIRLTLASYESGLIGRDIFEARLLLLLEIADPNSGAVRFAADLLGDLALDHDVTWPAGNRGEDGQSEAFETSGVYFDDADYSLALKIITGPLKDWEFHQADDDFFPSIPHGHHLGRKQTKLDVYLGWIYNKDKQTGREDRDSIVSLWNNRSFRDFARIAIDYYLDHYPRYSGWRVDDPRILPAIRRGRRFR
jgi:hypothetical protein